MRLCMYFGTPPARATAPKYSDLALQSEPVAGAQGRYAGEASVSHPLGLMARKCLQRASALSLNRLQGFFLSEPLFRGDPTYPKEKLILSVVGEPAEPRMRSGSESSRQLVFHKSPANWSHSCHCRKGALAAWQKGSGSAGNSTGQGEGRSEDFSPLPPLRRAAGWWPFYSFQGLLDAISRAVCWHPSNSPSRDLSFPCISLVYRCHPSI
ncbi:hypothetical protein M441DRAFT_384827 [Trichoderma asperellum CBS 433.97]|uniref:Uncharacterized protein n=1 Tax=Trichoderma asperellum (strain ATCC 204424 / CBS 433.97 / NBRC 101777) TaxID=1042311 RepID=A0A2T3ZBE4_TRIA4|nr:hypothetical protein M441DRAFT_384827 [Trichoderma asperellum CBS 433.97]PTB42133.1 hypothetical protein M441DRAFT_384827 [Trichoderma asperellum CBS 433.97]